MKNVLVCKYIKKLIQFLPFRAMPTYENLYQAGLSLRHCGGGVGRQQWVGLLHSHHSDRGRHLKCVHVRL